MVQKETSLDSANICSSSLDISVNINENNILCNISNTKNSVWSDI